MMRSDSQETLIPPDNAATVLFVECARVMARAGTRAALLDGLLQALADHLEIGSAAIFAMSSPGGVLEPVATVGLDEAAAVGLAAAVRNAAHPIARTAAGNASFFDVRPTAPGGPALRSHVPLVATRDGTPAVVGVLAVAHDVPMTPLARLLEAVGDLAAAAIRPSVIDSSTAG